MLHSAISSDRLRNFATKVHVIIPRRRLILFDHGWNEYVVQPILQEWIKSSPMGATPFPQPSRIVGWVFDFLRHGIHQNWIGSSPIHFGSPVRTSEMNGYSWGNR